MRDEAHPLKFEIFPRSSLRNFQVRRPERPETQQRNVFFPRYHMNSIRLDKPKTPQPPKKAKITRAPTMLFPPKIRSCIPFMFRLQPRNWMNLKLLSLVRMGGVPSSRGRAGASSPVGPPPSPCFMHDWRSSWSPPLMPCGLFLLFLDPSLPSISDYPLPCRPRPLVVSGLTKSPI